MTLNKTLLEKAANEARGLAIDAVHQCSSGHLGLPLGCAEVGAVLFGHALSYNPDVPRWLNRDRFVLSAGPGQMAAARFNTPEHKLFDHHVIALAGDGCMQEGVAMEAIAFAGHQRLD